MPDASETYLYYIFDPMCSWCYAFQPNWLALQNHLPKNVSVGYVVGGLASDSDEPMPSEMREKIQEIWNHIERVVPGTQFNYEFWEVNTPVRSTYPACRAILAAKDQGGEFVLPMLQAIQKKYYQDAKNPSLQTVLHSCALEIGLDSDQFSQDLTSDKIELELQNDIKKARSLVGNSFPTLCLVHQNKQFPILIDYSNWETMCDEITAAL